jgi:hypothetical protein
MRYLVALGRLFYSLIFVVAGFGHLPIKRSRTRPRKAFPSPAFWCRLRASWPSSAA